ncbi:MAG: zinc ribbon domain-containing protein [Verrucomicrobiota bacterium]|nr:zinc ribbon domain-containing protein [Verrucomicrobiota bacterium]
MSFKCPECSEILSEDALFCSECGTKVENNDSHIEQGPQKSDFNEDSNDALSESKTLKISEESICGIINRNEEKVIEEVDTNLDSDCEDFSLEWNAGSSVFIEKNMAALQFRIIPKSPNAKNAENFKLILELPDGSFKEAHIRYSRISSKREIKVNYRPKAGSKGAEQSAWVYFIYELEKEEKCFSEQIEIEVHPENEDAGKLFENMSINIGDITSQKAGGDIRLPILDELKKNKQDISSIELFKELRKSSLWQEVALCLAEPPENLEKKNLQIPYNSEKNKRLTLKMNDGSFLQLYSKKISLGRARNYKEKKMDLITRNLPDESEDWSNQKLRRKNQAISKLHASIELNDSFAVIENLSSVSETCINAVKINKHKISLNDKRYFELSLSPRDSSSCFPLETKIYKMRKDKKSGFLGKFLKNITENEFFSAILMKRYDELKEKYLILNHWLPLSEIFPEIHTPWKLYRQDDAFAITDGQNEWIWLTRGLKNLPKESFIGEVLEVPEQKGV